ncbi:MAG: hypothetical protein AABX38_07125 [Candidatus Micrarchaeota archaeon]
MDRQFDASYIDHELNNIGSRIQRQVSIYLIGGCAMSFRNLKETTKDIDIVFKDETDYDAFCWALFGAQYYEPRTIKSEHEKLNTVKMYENKDGFHLDLFIRQVVGKLTISESMIGRSELYKTYSKLSVYLLSKEDIFLFKGLASEGRQRDLPDMEVLYSNLNWNNILEELNSQKLSEELKQLFIRRLETFSKTYNLDVPILQNSKIRKIKE